MNVLSGCSGIGGLDLGFKAAGYRTVCYIEREPYPQSVLVDRIGEGLLDSAPIWNDFKTFDGKPWRGVVDCFVAGIPCQPHSHAGKRRGESDDRDLWPDMRRITSEVGPRVVVVENVPGLFSGPQAYGFRIVGDLQRMGYVVVKRSLSARAVGAPHRRERVFIIAIASTDSSGFGHLGGEPQEQSAEGRKSPFGRVGGCSQTEPSDSDSERLERTWTTEQTARSTGSYEAQSSDSEGERCPVRCNENDEVGERSDGSDFRKDGNQVRRRTAGLGEDTRTHALPNFDAFQGISKPEELFGRFDIPEPLIRRSDDGIPHRVDRIKGIGNAVVPQVAFQIATEIKRITG